MEKRTPLGKGLATGLHPGFLIQAYRNLVWCGVSLTIRPASEDRFEFMTVGFLISIVTGGTDFGLGQVFTQIVAHRTHRT